MNRILNRIKTAISLESQTKLSNWRFSKFSPTKNEPKYESRNEFLIPICSHSHNMSKLFVDRTKIYNVLLLFPRICCKINVTHDLAFFLPLVRTSECEPAKADASKSADIVRFCVRRISCVPTGSMELANACERRRSCIMCNGCSRVFFS